MPMPQLSMDEVRGMEKAGQLASRTLDNVEKYIKAGVTTNEINQIVHDFTLTHGAKPAPLGYNGFPKSVCTSVNECICHGVPDDRPLQDGDIINVDVTCILNGFHGDTSRMYTVGTVSSENLRLIDVAKEAMERGIQVIEPGGTVGDIGFAINKFVTKKGYFAVKEIGGHGIGRTFHGDPFVPSFGKKGKGEPLVPWTCITVEPMINPTDSAIVEFAIPGSTIKYYETSDKSPSAQWEHTVLITDTGYEIMTVS